MSEQIFGPYEAADVKCIHSSQRDPSVGAAVITEAGARAAREQITNWEGYGATPLVSLPGLASELGVAGVHYKDEGGRFGLGSFKALGGAYAVSCLVAEKSHIPASELTVTSATDGNHGRSVAWGARMFGCPCVIYIHAEVSEGRAQAMADLGAEVIRIDGNYDESVRQCAADAEAHGRYVVSDTSYEGYREVPTRVMEGYTVMLSEIVEQAADDVPTHVFVQGGVGGLAAAVHDIFCLAWGETRPRFVVVEPEVAACLYASAEAGGPRVFDITEESLMAGLSCGEVSLLAWESLGPGADDFMTIPESLVVPCMRLLARSPFGDPAITAGESAVAGLAAAIAAARTPALSEALGIGSDSRILTIGTEGATDPELYDRLIAA